MKHKKVAGFLAILCILSSVFSWQAQAAQDISGNVSGDIRSEEEQEDISLWMQKMEMQEEATQAYSELRSLFGVSESGMDIFPDDYAGAWIENNDLIVGLTTLDSVEKYDLVLGEFDCVQYVEMDYSLNELYEMRNDMYEQIKDDIEISCSYVHVAGNNIVYEVLEPVQAAEQKLENKLNTLRSGVDSDSDASSGVDLFNIVEGSEVVNQVDVYGGSEFKDGGGSASVGICGTIHSKEGNDYPGFITCGHGATVTGEGAKAYIGGSLYGSTFLTMYYNNCYGDWAAVRKTSNNFTQTNKVYGPSFDTIRKITGTKDEVAPGTLVMKYGFKGGYCTGTVTENNMTVYDDGGIYVTGISGVSLISGESVGGDSGGPYYINNGMGGYNFVGVHKGSNKKDMLYFTPYKCFKTWFTPDTN